MKRFKDYITSILICFLIGIVFLQASLAFWVLLFIGVSILIWRKQIQQQIFYPSVRIITLDWFLGLICLSEIILCLYSSYWLNSIKFLYLFLLTTILYFIIRKIIYSPRQFNFIAVFLSSISGFLALINIISFIFHYIRFTMLNFTDLTYLKHFYHPMGRLANDWATLFICLLPFSIFLFYAFNKKLRWIFICISILVLYAIIITLSRGAIVSVFSFLFCVFLFACLWQRKKLKLFGRQLLIIVSSIVLLCIPIRQSVITTLSMAKTTSQIRSVEGRFSKWKDAIYLFKQHPITGVGSGNYALASDGIFLKDKNMFNPRSTNSFLQILSEKGLLGMLTYGSFFLCLCVISYKKIKNGNWTSCIFTSAFISLCIRELFFSTLFEDNIVLTLCMLIIVFIFYPIIKYKRVTSNV